MSRRLTSITASKDFLALWLLSGVSLSGTLARDQGGRRQDESLASSLLAYYKLAKSFFERLQFLANGLIHTVLSGFQ